MRLIILMSVLASINAGTIQAHDFKVGDITIGHPWARATPPRIPTGAAYMVFENMGANDRLIMATSPAAAEVQFHENQQDGNVLQMRQVDSLRIPTGTTVTLKPSTMHLMLVGLKQPMKVGTKVPLTLVFEKAGSVTVELAVDKAGALGSGEGHKGHGE